MSWRVLTGHVLDVLPTLTPGSVQCVLTSPPYYGIRSYGKHPVAWPDGWIGELGHEPTPAMYVAHLVEVFRAMRPALRDDATVWLNLGDSYARRWSSRRDAGGSGLRSEERERHGRPPDGFNDGDMIGIPWRVAFALQADGWWLRSDVIWSKRSPMPESVNGVRWERCRVKVAPRPDTRSAGTPERPHAAHGAHRDDNDSGTFAAAECPGCPKCRPNDGLVLRRGSWRPTRSHEYVFLLAKSANYFADREAVLEPFVTHARENYPARAQITGRGEQGYAEARGDDRDKSGEFPPGGSGRNKRSVWTIGPAPFDGQHYATMPPELAEICIRAGTSERGACRDCGAPWPRIVERSQRTDGRAEPGDRERDRGGRDDGFTKAPSGLLSDSVTLGWRRMCSHSAPAVPCLVLDPFAGAGTSGLVADRLGRDCVLIDVSIEYTAMSRQRIIGDAPLFATASEATT